MAANVWKHLVINMQGSGRRTCTTGHEAGLCNTDLHDQLYTPIRGVARSQEVLVANLSPAELSAKLFMKMLTRSAQNISLRSHSP